MAVPLLRGASIASSAGIPLKVGDETVGLMFVTPDADRFDGILACHRVVRRLCGDSHQNAVVRPGQIGLERRIEFGALVAVDKAITTADLDSVLDRLWRQR
jgi:hypothetical protein